MSTIVLGSCWAKFGRAEEHLQTIRREIDAWRNRRPYRVIRQVNAEFTRHSLIIKVNKPPDLIRWSLVASDAIHNLRCALDHLVYAIGVHQSKTDPPPAANTLAFPICDTYDIFVKSRWRIDTLSDDVRAEIERLQPYNRPHKELPPPLRILRELDDANKHRLLHVAIAHQIGGELRNLTYRIDPGESIEVIVHTAEVVDGTEIMALVLNRPKPDLDYKFAADIVISVRHDKGPLGNERSEVPALLRELTVEVKTVIERVSSNA